MGKTKRKQRKQTGKDNNNNNRMILRVKRPKIWNL